MTAGRIGRGSWPTVRWLPSRRPGRSGLRTTATPGWPGPGPWSTSETRLRRSQDALEVEGRGASVGHVGYLVLGVVARARALAAGSDWPAAQQALEEARQILRERAVGNGLVQVVDGAVVEMAVESSDRERANRALERIPAGRARERLAIRVAGMGGSLTEAEAVRLARSVRPVVPRDVVDARLLMAAVTAASRPAEAEMHLSAAATIAYELGMLRALSGRSEEVVVLAQRVAQRAHEQAVAALVATTSAVGNRVHAGRATSEPGGA